MPFDFSTIDLPITEKIPAIRQHLQDGTTLILSAPPGAGKSTLLPLTLLDVPHLANKKIIMLEPRRLAAKSIAQRMADLLREKPGQTVGYRIRFETKIGPSTKIEVVTEGILTRMLQEDNGLEDVGLVIFDEFHERSIHADIALALVRESQRVLRPDLRILIMSATLNIPVLSELLDAPILESTGRQYPVEIHYAEHKPDTTALPERTAQTVMKAVKSHEGDVLVFLPGQGEITRCESILKQKLPDFVIHPLYGQLPFTRQQAAIFPNRQGKRKIVLATSIAETSLTIEGITIVVDSGFGRTAKFDPNSGLSKLETIPVSQDSADQRAGRAGRLKPGVCYRMWPKATHDSLATHRTPEILEADLAPLVLDMAQWGITDAGQLEWLTPLPVGHLAQANDVLHELEALEDMKITPHGKQIHQLPCHPRIAHMLLMADTLDITSLAADVAAVIEEKDPLPPESGIDLNLRIEALRRFRSNAGSGGRFAKIEKIAAQYRSLINAPLDNAPFDPYETGVLLAYAYPERIAAARPGNNAQFQLANGKYAMAGHKDDLAHEPWLAVAHIDARDGLGKIFMAAPLNPKDLAPLVRERETIEWNTKKGGLLASKDLRIGSIVLRSTVLTAPDQSKVIAAICKALQTEGESLLNFNDEVRALQNRIVSLKKWRSDESWPDFSTPSLLKTVNEWLSPYLIGIKTVHDLKKINLYDVLLHMLPYAQQQSLDKLAPQKLQVPSGSFIMLEYTDSGSPPVLAIRLQEVFGLTETPLINEGRQPILIHLLSPGFKLVQITSDLNSFWQSAYFEVRKDLKRRYPKHEWPDDPLRAEPIRGVKKKKL